MPTTDWYHYPMSLQHKMMREAGLEPAFLSEPDPKSGPAPLAEPVQQGSPRTEPHQNDASRTDHVTPDVTGENFGLKTSSVAPASRGTLNIVERNESLPLDNAVIRNVLAALHEGRPLSGWTPEKHSLAADHYSWSVRTGWQS